MLILGFVRLNILPDKVNNEFKYTNAIQIGPAPFPAYRSAGRYFLLNIVVNCHAPEIFSRYAADGKIRGLGTRRTVCTVLPGAATSMDFLPLVVFKNRLGLYFVVYSAGNFLAGSATGPRRKRLLSRPDTKWPACSNRRAIFFIGEYVYSILLELFTLL